MKADASVSPSPCRGCPWHEDFPVEWEADHYVTRRELAKFLTQGSGLLAAAGAALAVMGARPEHTAYSAQRICGVGEVPAGGSRLFRYPTEEDPCILVSRPDGEFRAYSQVCTHLACAVVHRPQSDSLFCPCHHGSFATNDGRPTGGPPTRRLPQIRLERRGEDLYAVGVEI